MPSIASAAVQLLSGSFAQQVGTAVARQQVASEKAVAALVAQSVVPAAPPGQGRVVDRRV